jgi:hypothetical protein
LAPSLFSSNEGANLPLLAFILTLGLIWKWFKLPLLAFMLTLGLIWKQFKLSLQTIILTFGLNWKGKGFEPFSDQT